MAVDFHKWSNKGFSPNNMLSSSRNKKENAQLKYNYNLTLLNQSIHWLIRQKKKKPFLLNSQWQGHHQLCHLLQICNLAHDISIIPFHNQMNITKNHQKYNLVSQESFKKAKTATENRTNITESRSQTSNKQIQQWISYCIFKRNVRAIQQLITS